MADIVLKDRQGNPVTFEGISALNVLLSDGTEQIMTLPGPDSGKSPIKMWSKTITDVSLPSQPSQSFALLADTNELPDWADLANIERTYALNSNIPIYILGLFAMTGQSRSSYFNYEFWANIVTNVSSTNSARMGGLTVGKANNSSVTAYDWFGTISKFYKGVCVKSGAIYAAQQNNYGGLSPEATYQLILIKINPTS